jgi:hypothetical protein
MDADHKKLSEQKGLPEQQSEKITSECNTQVQSIAYHQNQRGHQ